MAYTLGSVPDQHSPEESNELCQNYLTIGLISHRSKAMLSILLNRQKPQAEETTKEAQAGFTGGRSTTEQIINLTTLFEKYL